MNKKGISTITEQFLMFAIAMILFVMVVLAFRSVGSRYSGHADAETLERINRYVILQAEDVWSAVQAGGSPEVVRTAGIPVEETVYLTVEGGEVCSEMKGEKQCTPISPGVPLDGKTYTVEKFSIIGTKEGVTIE